MKLDAIGIMSGSSLDGLDVALVSFELKDNRVRWDLKQALTYKIPQSIKTALAQVRTVKSLDALVETEKDFTLFVSECVNKFKKHFQINDDFIAVHGHTVLHSPEKKYSWQLINAALLCESTQSRVVTDFRKQDMALGGQGAPMAVLCDKDLFPNFDFYINFGGIANISYQKNKVWCAYDIFPFNQVLNFYAQKLGKEYDKDGLIAATGVVNDELMQLLSLNKYFAKGIPKSLDNFEVMEEWIKPIERLQLKPKDIIRTFLEFASLAIVDIVDEKSKIFISGGGAFNSFFTKLLSQHLRMKKSKLHIPEDRIIDYKESVLIAYAGWKRVRGEANFISKASGAQRDTSGGAIYIPSTKLKI